MIALLDQPGTPLDKLALEDLHRLPSVDSVLSGGRPDVVVIGPGDPDPVRTTQQVRILDVPVVICAASARLQAIEDALRFAPQTPPDVTIIGLDDAGRVAAELRRAAERSRKRQRHVADVAAANRLLSEAVHPSSRVALDRLLQVAPVGILSIDERGSLHSWNSQAEQQFPGVLAAGVAFRDLFDERWHDIAEGLLRATEPSDAVRVTARNGQSYFDIRSAPFVTAAASPGVLIAAVDVTEGVRAEEESQRNRALLDVVFEGAPVGIGYWDRNRRFQRVNRAFAEIAGVTAEEHVGRTLEQVLPAFAPALGEALGQVMEHRKPVIALDVSGQTSANPGELRHWLVSCYPILLGGEIAGAGAVCEEVTERRRTEQAVSRALERERQARAEAERAEMRAAFLARAATELASSLDYNPTLASVAALAVPDVADWAAVDMLSADGTLQRVALAHTDPEKAEILRQLEERYPPGRDSPLWRTVENGQPQFVADIPPSLLEMYSQDAEHLAALQSLHPRSFIIVPIRTAERTAIGAITLVTAESGRRYSWADLRLADELADRVSVAVQNARLYAAAEQRRGEAEATAEQLRRVNAELEQFAWVTSHDLQEPLRTVASFAQLLEKRHGAALPSDARDYISHVVEGARRMSHLIHDLLEYSRVTREDGPRMRPVNMNEVMEECLASLRTAIDESGGRVTHTELPVVPRANQSQMQQLLLNLLSNAIKYARRDVPPDVWVDAVHEEGCWHFRVVDNGQGFGAEYHERIFGVFKRLHGRDVPGTGIGLALCRRIVERHGGTIRAESRPGEGSVFHFTIPD